MQSNAPNTDKCYQITCRTRVFTTALVLRCCKYPTGDYKGPDIYPIVLMGIQINYYGSNFLFDG